jgi:methylase of polypeptide subunit release factors
MTYAYTDYDSKVQELLILGSNEDILAVCASFLDPQKLHARERRLLEGVKPVSRELQNQVKTQIRAGVDVLGLSYMRANIASELRVHGETYTPEDIVENMLKCAESIRMPERVIDCGCGSGRFSIASANRFPKAKILAIDSSPFATIRRCGQG